MKRFHSTFAVSIFLLFTCTSAWSQIVEFRLETTDLAGNPVGTVSVGDDFLFTAYTSHVSGFSDPADAGVFSAFIDVSYDGGLASTTGPIDHALRFSTATSGNLSNGLIDDAGGLATDPGSVPGPVGPTEQLVFSVPFRADAPGALDFIGSGSGDQLFAPVLVFGVNTTIDPADVDFGSVSLTVVPEPSGMIIFVFGVAGLLFVRPKHSSRRRR